MDAITVTEGLLAAVALAVTTWMAWRLYDNLSVRFVQGKNDDSTVGELFTQLLRDVERDLIIHDDGDNSNRSMYNDPSIVDEIRVCLNEKAALNVRMYFNKRGDLEVNALTEAFPDRVSIRYNTGERSPSDIHYKIIDGGMQGHLSRHALGCSEREFEFYDCSRSRRHRERILGPYCERFERDFAAAAT